MDSLKSSFIPALTAVHLAACAGDKGTDTGIEKLANSFWGKIDLEFRLDVNTTLGICEGSGYTVEVGLCDYSSGGYCDGSPDKVSGPFPLLEASSTIPDVLIESMTAVVEDAVWETMRISLTVAEPSSECLGISSSVELDTEDLQIYYVESPFGDSHGEGTFDIKCSANPFGLGIGTGYLGRKDISCDADTTWTETAYEG